MKRFSLALLALSSPAAADPTALAAYVAAFEAEDPAACVATFAPDARFIDLGNDFSARVDWFCNAVIDGGGRYTILSQQTEGATTTADIDYRMGGYFLEGRAILTGEGGRITDLVIERRRGVANRLASPLRTVLSCLGRRAPWPTAPLARRFR